MKVRIEKELCTGCGLCADTCPDVFVMSGDTAEVKAAEVPANLVEQVKEAVANCPTEAIKAE
jgi:ferredoxin